MQFAIRKLDFQLPQFCLLVAVWCNLYDFYICGDNNKFFIKSVYSFVKYDLIEFASVITKGQSKSYVINDHF